MVKLVYMPGVHVGSAVGVQKRGRRSEQGGRVCGGEPNPGTNSCAVHLGEASGDMKVLP